jgi:hypothetical protein
MGRSPGTPSPTFDPRKVSSVLLRLFHEQGYSVTPYAVPTSPFCPFSNAVLGRHAGSITTVLLARMTDKDGS